MIFSLIKFEMTTGYKCLIKNITLLFFHRLIFQLANIVKMFIPLGIILFNVTSMNTQSVIRLFNINMRVGSFFSLKVQWGQHSHSKCLA